MWSVRFPRDGHWGPNPTGIGPGVRKLTRLFHPRRYKWSRYFRSQGGALTLRATIGRTTMDMPRINLSNLVELRVLLMGGGLS